jgi:hypothetical protein
MSVVGKVWFSQGAAQRGIIKRLWDKFAANDLPFPSDKDNAIVINTSLVGDPSQVIFPLKSGQSTDFPIPEFAKHEDKAWDVSHLNVQINGLKKTTSLKVDKFNELIMKIFNMAAGNMLADGNVLSWNVWFIAPQIVDGSEWERHALKWRKSIQADHGSPMGGGTDAKYFDGSPFKAFKSLVENEEQMLEEFEQEHF